MHDPDELIPQLAYLLTPLDCAISQRTVDDTTLHKIAAFLNKHDVGTN